MKARIIKTGEVVDVQPGSLIAIRREGDDSWNGEELTVEEVQIIPDGYNEVRTRAAIAAMQGFITTMSNESVICSIHRNAQENNMVACEWVAETAVTYADALVNALFNTNVQHEADKVQNKG